MPHKIIAFVLAASAASCLSAPALAAVITDPIGDFIPTYLGPHQADLDVTSFSVSYNSALSEFSVQSTFAGALDTTIPDLYAIGVNTGTGPANFASIGHPGVIFNNVIAVSKNGTATIGGTPLAPGAVSIAGNVLNVIVPLALLPSTGFSPEQYGFNIWPRSAVTLDPGQPPTGVISDFAPNNSTVAAVATPEPASWALMIAGFGVTGVMLRRRAMAGRRRTPSPA
jgi:hypothetical protein